MERLADLVAMSREAVMGAAIASLVPRQIDVATAEKFRIKSATAEMMNDFLAEALRRKSVQKAERRNFERRRVDHQHHHCGA